MLWKFSVNHRLNIQDFFWKKNWPSFDFVEMKNFTLFLVLLIINFSWIASKPMQPGMTGRYCAAGTYNINTGQLSNYDDDHYCGIHLIGKFPSFFRFKAVFDIETIIRKLFWKAFHTEALKSLKLGTSEY